MKFALEQRMRFIDFLLMFYGSIGKKEIEVYFGISPAAATRDLKEYEKISGGNAVYNRNSRRWVRSEIYASLFEGDGGEGVIRRSIRGYQPLPSQRSRAEICPPTRD